MATQDELKRIAAEKAVEFVPENEYIGIGSGSTVNMFIEALGKSGKKIKGAVSTSKKSSELMAQYDIPEVSLNDVMGANALSSAYRRQAHKQCQHISA